MEFELNDSQRRWRQEVRDFLAAQVPQELRDELWQTGGPDSPEGPGPHLRVFWKKLSEKRWFGLTWPKEYGGLGRGAVDQQILLTELDYAGVPGPDLTVTSVAPMIMEHGTPQNKAEFLPGIAKGEITAAVGYSEPDAGTDLASLRTQAVLDGDEWVINGSKIWNSHAHHTTHEWLCVRTDPLAPKHRGISVIMVPIDTPGIEIRPLITWRGSRTNEAFFTDVRVPRTHLIGEVNKGWQYITGALDLERGFIVFDGEMRREVDRLIERCGTTTADGVRLADRPEVRRRLAELDAGVEVARLFALEAASQVDEGAIPTITLTTAKIYTSELRQKIADYGMQIFGAAGQLDRHDPDAPLNGAMEWLYRSSARFRFAGGTNEVLRDVIAQRGHGMPSSGRRPSRPADKTVADRELNGANR
ncbi:acyl-CoA dehydrogenase family protein [Streptomyces albipurpureus]|uniref:Acyl-CoA dehydrogenase family protein n=1 Tax=Streptomyces albipurpureus TaxID=2897419 RepID=A0ABT0UHJ5_9ACTN|nr:acyl-CoA dehydrogenase family protein [Streptomyces sp. CWNU-1]MCM2387575.1 acyl-CoA dehydrogenase family protein [Streptomyces sp. CWNU-1]